MPIPNYYAPIAIKIDAPRTASFLQTLHPYLEEMDFEKELKGNYLVHDWPGDGQYVVMSPEQFESIFSIVRDAWFLKPVLVEENNRDHSRPSRYIKRVS